MTGKDPAWSGIVDYPVKGRLEKPRTTGITMVMDKGLPLVETKGFLEMCSDQVDYLKLTFGTSAFYTRELLRDKISLARDFGVPVYPGGTFLEVAMLQGRAEEYLDRALELGFDTVEVSDGTIDLSKEDRVRVIESAIGKGLRVISEVGKKGVDEQQDCGIMIEYALLDLGAGVDKVIIEGRESGKGVGIYNPSGGVKDELLERISAALPMQDIIWEAPLKNQQEELILRYGPNVNLGNIPPGDILALEALRVGLRGDTLKATLKGWGDFR